MKFLTLVVTILLTLVFISLIFFIFYKIGEWHEGKGEYSGIDGIFYILDGIAVSCMIISTLVLLVAFLIIVCWICFIISKTLIEVKT